MACAPCAAWLPWACAWPCIASAPASSGRTSSSAARIVTRWQNHAALAGNLAYRAVRSFLSASWMASFRSSALIDDLRVMRGVDSGVPSDGSFCTSSSNRRSLRSVA